MSASDFSDVFVSYRRVDVEFVKDLVEQLQASGKEVWIDWEDIPPGSVGFSDDIKRGLEGADAFIAVLSPDYLESTYCVDLELKYAIDLKKKIIPIVLHKFDGKPIPDGIGHINWIYFTPHAGQENTFDESYPRIIEALDSDLEHTRTHKRFLLRALEWDQAERQDSYLLEGDEITEAETWLANSAGKNPYPTDLHKDYVLASRKRDTRRQRILLSGVSVALVVSVILSVLSFIGFQRATVAEARAHDAESTAIANEERALMAEATAVRRAELADANRLASHLPAMTKTNPFLAYALAEDVLHVENLPDNIREIVASTFYDTTAVMPLSDTIDATFPLDAVFTPDNTSAVVVTCADTVEFPCPDINVAWWDVINQELMNEYLIEADGEGAFTVQLSSDAMVIFIEFCEDLDNPDGALCWTDVYDSLTGEYLGILGQWGEILTSPEWIYQNQCLTIIGVDDEDEEDAVCAESEIVFLDYETGEFLYEFFFDERETRFAGVSPDGSKIAIYVMATLPACEDCPPEDVVYRPESIQILDIETNEVLNELFVGGVEASRVWFIDDGNSLLYNTRNEMKRWDLEADSVVATYILNKGTLDSLTNRLFSAPVKTLLLSDDEQLMFAGLDLISNSQYNAFISEGLTVFNLETGQKLGSYDMGLHPLIDVSADGLLVITATDDQIVLHELSSNRIQLISGGVLNAYYINNGEQIFTHDGHGHFGFYDPDTLNPITLNEPDEEFEIDTLHLSEDTTQALISDFSRQQMIVDIQTNEILNVVDGIPPAELWHSPTEVFIARNDNDSVYELWSSETGDKLRALATSEAIYTTMRFMNDGSQLMGIHGNGITTWDVATGEVVNEQSIEPLQDVEIATLSDDGSVALLVQDNRLTVFVWDVVNQRILRRFDGHRNPPSVLAISPDNTFALTSDFSTTMFYWNIRNGTTLRSIPVEGNEVIRFAPRGNQAIYNEWDSFYSVDLIPPDAEMLEWVQINRRVPDLSCAERDEHRSPVRCEEASEGLKQNSSPRRKVERPHDTQERLLSAAAVKP